MNKKFILSLGLVLSLSMVAQQGNLIYAAQPYYTMSFQEKIGKFDVNKAFDPSLYYARSILSKEGQKAWDVALDTLLNYDNSDNKYPLKDGNSAVTINFKELGISIDKEQAGYIQKYLVRQEPRMFHLKDWGATYTLDQEGRVETQTFYIGNGVAEGNSYQQILLKIEDEASKILSNIKEDMTIYQAIQAVQKEYEASITYSNTGSPGDIRGALLDKKAICGGYSKGFEYLLLRMGIENVWVNGYAGGAHAWNYVNINDKWYLMDTTWGGKNWYLRGEVANHQVYDTYHIMPTLEKEGVPYIWGQYPGLWMNTLENTIITVGDTFDPLEYIQDVGDIYGSDLNGEVEILENNVNTTKAGDYTVIYQVENKDGNKVQAELLVKVVNGKKVPAQELDKLSGNLISQPVSLYFNGKEVPYNDGLFVGEAGSIIYDIENKNIKYFEANVGINKNVRDNTAYGHYGKVQFEVYADDVLIYQSDILGWKDNYEHICIDIPENTKTIKLVNVPKGNGNNHGAWGAPILFAEYSQADIARTELEQVIEFADQITDVSYVLSSNHKESRFENLVYYRNYAKDIMNTDNLSVEEYKQASQMLIYCIEEVGQSYVVGGSPIK